MEALFEIIKNQMLKHQVHNYHLQQILMEAGPLEKVSIEVNNDFYFFVNAFTDEGTLNGRISGIGGGNALNIDPLMANMKIYKYQIFKGKMLLQNNDALNTLYVELMRVTPIPVSEN